MSAYSQSLLATLAKKELKRRQAIRSTENARIDTRSIAGAYALHSDEATLPSDAEYALARYQRAWIRDCSRFKIFVKSRRIGGSYAAALDCALSACGLIVQQDGSITFDREQAAPQRIASATENRAKEFLGRVADHLYNLQRLCKVPLIEGDPAEQHIKLRNGVRCYAMAPSPKAIRGGEGDVVLDEFAFMPKQGEVWSAAKAVTDATLGRPNGYKLRVISTPFGDDDLFYRFANGQEGPSFSVHWCDVHTAIAQGFPADADQLYEEARTEDEWQQEYLCQFLSSADRYISAELYDACVYDFDTELPTHISPGIGYGGMDVARKATGDLSALYEVRRINERLWQTRGETRRGASWEQQEQWVAEALSGSLQRMAVDATGLGNQFAERLQGQHGGRIEPVEFTAKSKEQLASGIRMALERGLLRPRSDDTDLRRDVLSLRREQTEAGNVRFTSERNRDRDGKKSHADRAWALALAVHAAGKPMPDKLRLSTRRTSEGTRAGSLWG